MTSLSLGLPPARWRHDGPVMRDVMPRVSEFYGIVIYMYYDDHPAPHFHAVYGGDEAEIRIADLSVVAGGLPPRAIGLVMEWGAAHRAELDGNWQLSRDHRPLNKIPPLA